MCVCVWGGGYMCVCVCVYVCGCACAHVYVCAHAYDFVHACTHACFLMFGLTYLYGLAYCIIMYPHPLHCTQCQSVCASCSFSVPIPAQIYHYAYFNCLRLSPAEHPLACSLNASLSIAQKGIFLEVLYVLLAIGVCCMSAELCVFDVATTIRRFFHQKLAP